MVRDSRQRSLLACIKVVLLKPWIKSRKFLTGFHNVIIYSRIFGAGLLTFEFMHEEN